MSSVEFFGGAITARLPVLRTDISDLRAVPDNQEVFAHPSTDQSIIVEVMEYQHAEDDNQALRTYFQDLADTNSAQVDVSSLSYQPVELSSLCAHQCRSCLLMKGIQLISKFKDTSANTVQIYMALLRLPQFSSDILLTFNNTQQISLGSSSHQAESSSSPNAWTYEDFVVLLKSLTIVNEGLFG